MSKADDGMGVISILDMMSSADLKTLLSLHLKNMNCKDMNRGNVPV